MEKRQDGYPALDKKMKKRFVGKAKRPELLQALKHQIIVAKDDEISEALVDAGKVIEVAAGKAFITQNDAEQKVFLILTGNVAININGAQVATRTANEHVGEMVVIDPTLPRSATAVALDHVVALAVDGAKFKAVCKKFPQIWENIARVLARRLYQRNSTIFVPNTKPRVFVISSSEGLYVADEVKKLLSSVATVIVWNQDVFFAGGYTIEALESQLLKADYAIAIATPDDQTKSRGKTRMSVRDNVIFELGLFMGKLTRFRTFLLHPSYKTFSAGSDFHGLTAIRYQKGAKKNIAARLKPACAEIRKIMKSRSVRTFEFENR